MWVYWLILMIILVIIEAVTSGLFTIWFVFSSILALITSLFTDNFLIQLGVFVIAGLIFLILTKPIVKKLKMKTDAKTNFDRIIGEIAVVTKEINKNEIGEVKIDGKLWSAKASENIKVNETVKVLQIDSTKLIVEKEEK